MRVLSSGIWQLRSMSGSRRRSSNWRTRSGCRLRSDGFSAHPHRAVSSPELLGVDAAGLLLADGRGALRLVAGSTEQARVAELFQIQNDEGPCVDCFHSGQAIVISDIRTSEIAKRWPLFAPAAIQMVFAAVHAIPMRLRDQVIGTLYLFRTAPNGMDQAVARAARALVDVATIGILQERAVRQQEACRRAAASRAAQQSHDRASQGSPGRTASRDPRPGVSHAAELRAQPQLPAHRAGRRGHPGHC